MTSQLAKSKSTRLRYNCRDRDNNTPWELYQRIRGDALNQYGWRNRQTRINRTRRQGLLAQSLQKIFATEAAALFDGVLIVSVEVALFAIIETEKLQNRVSIAFTNRVILRSKLLLPHSKFVTGQRLTESLLV